MSTLDVPSEEGIYTVDGYEITVEEREYETNFSGYDATKIGEVGCVDVYEDEDGDYWLDHRGRGPSDDEGAVLIGRNNPLYDVLENEL